jgi:amino acid transporter
MWWPSRRLAPLLPWSRCRSLISQLFCSCSSKSTPSIDSSARVLFAIGRDSLIHQHFAHVNGQKAPAAATAFIGGTAILLALAGGAIWGPANAFNVMTTAVLFGLVTNGLRGR